MRPIPYQADCHLMAAPRTCSSGLSLTSAWTRIRFEPKGASGKARDFQKFLNKINRPSDSDRKGHQYSIPPRFRPGEKTLLPTVERAALLKRPRVAKDCRQQSLQRGIHIRHVQSWIARCAVRLSPPAVDRINKFRWYLHIPCVSRHSSPS